MRAWVQQSRHCTGESLCRCHMVCRPCTVCCGVSLRGVSLLCGVLQGVIAGCHHSMHHWLHCVVVTACAIGRTMSSLQHALLVALCHCCGMHCRSWHVVIVTCTIVTPCVTMAWSRLALGWECKGLHTKPEVWIAKGKKMRRLTIAAGASPLLPCHGNLEEVVGLCTESLLVWENKKRLTMNKAKGWQLKRGRDEDTHTCTYTWGGDSSGMGQGPWWGEGDRYGQGGPVCLTMVALRPWSLRCCWERK